MKEVLSDKQRLESLYHGRFELIKPRGDRMEEECGIIGAFDPDGDSVTDILYYGLYALQHRGQEAAGIATSDGENITYYKNQGLVTECFEDDERYKYLKDGHIGIGHVRYSTAGDKSVVNAQPLFVHFKGGDLALAHNGNLINAECIRSRLEEQGYIHQTNVDTEVIAGLVARRASTLTIEKSLEETSKDLRGSYALVVLEKDKLIAMRDPLGIRPLALGRVGNVYVVASESCVFDTLNGELIRDLHPGEILTIDKDGLHSTRTQVPLESKLCVFEFVYFARSDSIIDGVSVYKAREEAGRRLALRDNVKADIVVGVPDSAFPAAIGYSKQSGIPFIEGLVKNRYVGRTFIQPGQQKRERSVKIKLNALKRNVQGKRIVLVDDSIVRGTTSKKIVEMLKSAGALEVHMRISSPVVTNPCYFGIDIAESKQLIGSGHNVEEIRKAIGADSLEYLTIEDLMKTVEGSSCGFCTGCFTGNYPMNVDTESKYCPF